MSELEEAAVAILAQQIWSQYQTRQRQSHAGYARAAALTPERRQEIARNASAAAQAKRIEQRRQLTPA